MIGIGQPSTSKAFYTLAVKRARYKTLQTRKISQPQNPPRKHKALRGSTPLPIFPPNTPKIKQSLVLTDS